MLYLRSANRIGYRFWKHFSRFRRDRRGNVAMIVAFAIIPLVGALGLATDTSRGYLVKARLSQALDAAVLAGGKVYYSESRNDDIRKFFRANFPSSALPVFDAPYQADFMDAEVTLNTPVESRSDPDNPPDQLTMTAQATIPTTFMRVLGFENVTVTAATQATRVIKGLDLVLSFDMSASMKNPPEKILKSRDAAITLLDSLYGADNDASPIYTVDGTDYNMLRVGFVPWNAEVNIRVQQTATTLAPITPVVTKNVGSKTNPVTGQSQSVVYYAGQSATSLDRVPLLMDPRTPAQGGQLPGGWTGCVYARYLGDNDNTNDGDLEKGEVVKNGKDWFGYEPEASDDGEPRTGNNNGRWTDAEGGGSSPNYTRWSKNANGQKDYRARSCNNSYFLDTGAAAADNADGSIKTYTTPNGQPARTSRPAAVPNPSSGR